MAAKPAVKNSGKTATAKTQAPVAKKSKVSNKTTATAKVKSVAKIAAKTPAPAASKTPSKPTKAMPVKKDTAATSTPSVKPAQPKYTPAKPEIKKPEVKSTPDTTVTEKKDTPAKPEEKPSAPAKSAGTSTPSNPDGTEKLYYSDGELKVFKSIIEEKLTQAKEELSRMSTSLKNPNANGIDDTTGGNSSLDDGSETLEKEQLGIMAQRTKKFIENLEFALIRIQNKTYGICRETGKLIPKERLMAVPHATLSIEAKNKQYK